MDSYTKAARQADRERYGLTDKELRTIGTEQGTGLASRSCCQARAWNMDDSDLGGEVYSEALADGIATNPVARCAKCESK